MLDSITQMMVNDKIFSSELAEDVDGTLQKVGITLNSEDLAAVKSFVARYGSVSEKKGIDDLDPEGDVAAPWTISYD